MESGRERARLLLRGDVMRLLVITSRQARDLLLTSAWFLAACSSGEPKQRYALGRPATPSEIARRDIDVGPDGAGLPPGRGSVGDGATIYAQKCASCHGERGEGKRPVYPALIGRDTSDVSFAFGKNAGL